MYHEPVTTPTPQKTPVGENRDFQPQSGSSLHNAVLKYVFLDLINIPKVAFVIKATFGIFIKNETHRKPFNYRPTP